MLLLWINIICMLIPVRRMHIILTLVFLKKISVSAQIFTTIQLDQESFYFSENFKFSSFKSSVIVVSSFCGYFIFIKSSFVPRKSEIGVSAANLCQNLPLTNWWGLVTNMRSLQSLPFTCFHELAIVGSLAQVWQVAATALSVTVFIISSSGNWQIRINGDTDF